MKLISLVRHGQASFGSKNYDKLSPIGIAQSQCLGDNFRHANRQVHALMSGNMQRQKDSLKHFLSHYDVTGDGFEHANIDNSQIKNLANPSPNRPLLLGTDNRFNEFNHQQVLFKAGLGFDDKASFNAFLANQPKPELILTEKFAQAMKRWQGGEFDSDYDESWQGFLQRTWGGFQQLIEQTNEHEHAMVFTSGGVIASIMQHVMRLTNEQAFELNWHIANASIHQFRVSDTGVFLQTFNEFSYLYQQGKQMVTWR